jgi:hypothetical protein
MDNLPSEQSVNSKKHLYLILGAIVLLAVIFYLLPKLAGFNSDLGVAATQKSSLSSGSVWADLKARGLQGEHYTLNIHGKKSDFSKSDCTVAPDPITGQYSNNIFVPSYSGTADRNQIIMTSGNAKGKWASTNPVYGVRDACTAPFDGDAAELVLPANEKGYYVTARVLGKPTDNPLINLTGSLLLVQDENGNDLLVLGLVTDNGFEMPNGTLSRQTGKVKAVDITGLFNWSGSVCYLSTQNYCYDSQSQYICTDRQICCTDSDLDGVYEFCTDPTVALDGTNSCPVGSSLLSVGCLDYINEWVFNIGDLVKYMWDTYTDGNFKLANIRFYPVR